MTLSRQIALVLAACAVTMFVTIKVVRHLNPPPVVEQQKEKKVNKKKTKNVVTKEPDGTITTETTVTEEHSVTNTDTVTAPPPKNHLQAVIATDIRNLTTPTPVYGISYSRSLVGPVTVGVLGLTNGTVGATVGVTF